MTAIRLSFACLALLTAAMTTFVAVGPQPANARVAACTNLPEPVRA